MTKSAQPVLVAPSLLAFDMSNLSEAAKRLEQAGADLLHADVMDGHFVPNLTFGWPLIAALKKHTKLPIDAHLMVTNPDRYLDEYAKAGVSWLSVHIEAAPHILRTVNRIRELGMKAGVAINPGTSLTALDAVLDSIDYVLLMTVNPGYGGQSFVQGGFERAAALKKMIGDRPVRIEIDGAVKPENAAQAVAAGCSMIVSGSGISLAADWGAAIARIRGS